MFIVRNRIAFYTFSIALSIASIVALVVWGLRPGIDLKGGSIMEIEYVSERPSMEDLRGGLDSLGLGTYSIRPTGETGYIIRTGELDQAGHSAVLAAIDTMSASDFEEKRFNSIGPVLGEEALQKSWISILLVLAAIVLFITFAFRKVSRPVSSWKYGLMAIVGLAHNILITAGAFAVLGQFAGFEVDTLFVTALLVILGFSVHDTIVVFDRVRENLHINSNRSDKKNFEHIVGDSINQTFVRSINTSLTTLIAIAALYVFGPETTKHFSLALFIGIAFGTYSSIFICAPLLITLNRQKDSRSDR
ncbi:MAG: protein translocase subunit SecF [bacterium]|nr:protein translocase subunit SecF [bacterium]